MQLPLVSYADDSAPIVAPEPRTVFGKKSPPELLFSGIEPIVRDRECHGDDATRRRGRAGGDRPYASYAETMGLQAAFAALLSPPT